MTRRGLAIRLLGLGASATGLWLLRERLLAPAVASLADGAATSGWIAFANADAPILTIPLSLAGAPVTGLLDSGAEVSAVDRALAMRLGLHGAPLPIIAFGLSGRPELGQAATLTVRAGGLSLGGVRAAQLDLSSIGAPADIAFSVILGQNALAAVATDIDFPHQRLAFHLPQGYRPPPGAVAADTRLSRGRLLARIRIAGVPLEVVVDTGASATLALARDVAEAAGLLRGQTIHQGSSITLGGTGPGQMVEMRDLEFAGAQFARTWVQLYERPTGGVVGPALLPSGLLGLGALRPFRTILVLGAGRLYIAPPAGDGPTSGYSSQARG
jgi:predicted aspartyl protease